MSDQPPYTSQTLNTKAMPKPRPKDGSCKAKQETRGQAASGGIAMTWTGMDAMDGSYVGGCQNYGPFLDPHYNTAPNI